MKLLPLFLTLLSLNCGKAEPSAEPPPPLPNETPKPPVETPPGQTPTPGQTPPVETPPPCSLILKVANLRNSNGQICYNVFQGANGFPDNTDPAVAKKCEPIEKDSNALTVTVAGLGCNLDYAVTLIHDEDSDEKLKKGSFGIPKEGIGMSRNPNFFRIGSPPYNETNFTINTPNTVQTVNVYYF